MIKIIFTFALSLSLISCFKSDPNREFKSVHRLAHEKFLPDVNAHGKNPSGFSRTDYLKARKELVKHVEKGDIQVVNEGHQVTLIIPTDKYFIFDSSRLNDLKHAPLTDIVNIIKCFPNTTMYVAGFTDDVGSYEHKRKLSQERAQAITAYLWSHGINERMIEAEGYGDKYAHANNNLIHGSALNRRVEIQWSIQ